jgi:hypothetical protein
MFSIAVPIRKRKANAKPASAPIFPLAVLDAIVLPVPTIAVADTFILLVVLSCASSRFAHARYEGVGFRSS